MGGWVGDGGVVERGGREGCAEGRVARRLIPCVVQMTASARPAQQQPASQPLRLGLRPAPPPGGAAHLGRRLADVVQHSRHRRLQRLVGVAPRRQLDQPLPVLLDVVAALGVAAGRAPGGRDGRAAVGGWRAGQLGGTPWVRTQPQPQGCQSAGGCPAHSTAPPAPRRPSCAARAKGSTGRPAHPFSTVAAFSTCSCGAGVTSSMPMEKPALPMKRALQHGWAQVGGGGGGGQATTHLQQKGDGSKRLSRLPS